MWGVETSPKVESCQCTTFFSDNGRLNGKHTLIAGVDVPLIVIVEFLTASTSSMEGDSPRSSPQMSSRNKFAFLV